MNKLLILFFMFSLVLALPQPDIWLDMKSDYADKTGNFTTTTASAPTCGGTSCNFDGAADYIDTTVQSDLEGAQNATCAIWAKSDGAATGQFATTLSSADVATSYINWGNFWHDAGELIYFRAGNGGTTWDDTLAEATMTDWHHYVVKYNSTAIYSFRDGVLGAGAAAGGTISGDLRNMMIGATYDGAYKYFWDGDLTQAACWFGTDIIGQDEIDELYAAGRTATYAEMWLSGNTLVVYSPTNTTINQCDVGFTFKAINLDHATTDVWYNIDGGEETYYEADNDTSVTINMPFTTEDVHVLVATATFDAGNQTVTRYFTTNFYDVSGKFDSDVYASGEPYTFYEYIRYYITNGTSWSNYLTLNSTDYATSYLTGNATHYVYYKIGTMPLVTGDDALFWNVTYSNTFWNETTSTEELELRPFNIDDCDTYTHEALTFTCRDELVGDTSDCTVNGVFTVSTYGGADSQDINLTWTGGSEHSVCLRDADATYLVDADLEYYNSTTKTRNYYIVNYTFTNETQEADLYMISDTTDAKLTKVEVSDVSASAQEDVVIYVNKYYYALDDYETVAMMKTDALGKANTYIFAPDVTYQLILMQDKVVANTYDNLKPVPDYATDEIELSLLTSPDALVEFWEYYGQVAVSTSWDNDTKAFVVTYADTSGLMQNITLGVSQFSYSGATSACTDYSSASSGTLTCDLTGLVGEYNYHVAGEFGSTELPLEAGSIVITTPATFGNEGILAAAYLIITLGSAIAIPEVSVLMAFVGLVVGHIFKLYILQTATIFAMMIVALAVIWKVKR